MDAWALLLKVAIATFYHLWLVVVPSRFLLVNKGCTE